jgi:alanyl-tRNA synthetase
MGGGESSGQGDGVREISGVKFFARIVSGVEMKDLKSLADEAKDKVGSGLVAIVGLSEDGKAGLVVAVTKDLVGSYNAVDLVRIGSDQLGGKGGGGRPDMAQAGGPNAAGAQAALDAIAHHLTQAQ